MTQFPVPWFKARDRGLIFDLDLIMNFDIPRLHISL